ncbi:glutamate receptor ionotropic, delta-2-like [Palaemon carinicauda]|uniref:glutamate receptor ionotropic, delta-2-like n=1 Tax=Palaemon carinicauda TaxID=392227 RepID=UPI0035B65C7F
MLTVHLILGAYQEMMELRNLDKDDSYFQRTSPVLSLDGYRRHTPGERLKNRENYPVHPEFLQFLLTSSPPHLFFLIYDDSIQEGGQKDGPKVAERDTVAGGIRFQDHALHILPNCVKTMNLESPYLWWVIIVMEDTVKISLETMLREGAQVTIIIIESNLRYRIYSSVVDATNKISFQETGTWNLHHPQELEKSSLQAILFPNMDDDFRGRQLTVAANNDYPFMVLEEEGNGELQLGTGIDANVVRVLSEYLNFTYRVVTPDDGGWGGPLPNGTVTGMIGMVARREAHFAITDITITESREEVADFTTPYYIESMTLVSRRPREKNRAFAAFSPFTPLVNKDEVIFPETWILKKAVGTVPKGYGVNNSLFNIFRSLVRQENLLSSPYWSQKFIFFFWYIFCLVISVVYSGMLIATLVTPSFEKPIDSLSDLPEATASGFTVLVTDETSDAYMFKEAKQGVYAQTWKLFNHDDRAKSFIPSATYGMDLILKEKSVYIVAQLASKFIAVRKGFRRYYFARDNFAIQYYGIPCVRGANYRYQFDKILMRINEGALITKWINDEFQKISTNANVEDTDAGPQAFSITHLQVRSTQIDTGPQAFTIIHLQAAFYILLLGYLIAAVVFFIESIMTLL